jgi:hypothetical protein
MTTNSNLRYQAIVFDLDGTAIPNSETGIPSPRLIDTIATHRHRIHLIAATGRPFSQAFPIIQALGLTDPCIILGGTSIIDPLSGAALTRTNLPPESVKSILALLEPYPGHIFIRSDNTPDTPLDRAALTRASPLHDNVAMICLDHLSDSQIPGFKARLEQLPKVLVTSAPSWNSGHFVMISHIDATKEHAIAEVLHRLHVTRTTTIGVGDGDNDLHLFAGVGLKVAMGNATARLKSVADLTCAPVEQDGLADIIEQYTSIN